METFLIILGAVLTSSVISALISSFVSVHIKQKELEVKLKLEEKNKWIENISEAHKDYIVSTTEYMNDLMAYSLKKISREAIAKRLNATNRTHNTLIFYMFQSEYNLESVEDAEKIMVKNTDSFNEQQETVTEYLNGNVDIERLQEVMGKVEIDVGANHYEFSEKLGIMIRVEKKEMANEIINRPLINKKAVLRSLFFLKK